MDWVPATAQEVRERIAADWISVDPELRSRLATYLIEPEASMIGSSGAREQVFVVARHLGNVVYFDDVDDEFGVATDRSGELRNASLIGKLSFALQALEEFKSTD